MRALHFNPGTGTTKTLSNDGRVLGHDEGTRRVRPTLIPLDATRVSLALYEITGLGTQPSMRKRNTRDYPSWQ